MIHSKSKIVFKIYVQFFLHFYQGKVVFYCFLSPGVHVYTPMSKEEKAFNFGNMNCLGCEKI